MKDVIKMPATYREELYQRFVSKLPTNIVTSSASMEQIREAYDFAFNAHDGQYRKGGNHDPYITHPVDVALIVATEMRFATPPFIEAALLHDVIEDTPYTFDDVASKFGTQVAEIVEGLTKVTNHTDNMQFSDSEQKDTFKKILLSLNPTPWVIYIKLADRVHNMRTIEDMKDEQKRRKANENLVIYAPIAQQLGLYDIKNELEDLSFKHYLSNNYLSIKKSVDDSSVARDNLFADVKLTLMRILVKTPYTCRISIEKKSFYSVFQIMRRENKNFEDIDNYQAVRIIFDTDSSDTEDTIYHKHYDIYASINQLFTEKENSRRDYLKSPKSNGFKALIFSILYQEQWVEVQIITSENNLIAHKGYASDSPHRIGLSNLQLKMSGLSIEDSSDVIVSRFSNNFGHLNEPKVITYTPDSKIVELPEGASVLDFAYHIHSNLGNHCFGAIINSKTFVSREYVLKQGERVKILSSPSVKPNISWNPCLKSGHSQECLNRYLNSHACFAADYKKGEQRFNSIMMQNHCIPNNSRLFASILSYYKMSNSREFYLEVLKGDDGKVGDFIEVVKKLKQSSKYADVQNTTIYVNRRRPSIIPHPIDYKKPMTLTNDLPYIMPSCCHPIPGDDALVFTDDEGVMLVHRRDCEETKKRLATRGKEITNVVWSEGLKPALAYVNLCGVDRIGMIVDISTLLLKNNINVKQFEINANDRLFNGWLLLYVKDIDELNNIMKQLNEIEGVTKVNRINIVNGRHIAVF